jgi:hypothetical protein
MTGRHHSRAARKKMSEAIQHYLAARRKAGLPHFLAGRKRPEDQIEKQRQTMKGRYKGSANPAWKGGRKINLGYFYVLCPGHPEANSLGYVREHRLVMEKKLGRLLRPGEIVHHINGIKTDNRPENLSLFPSNKAHSDFHQICPHCGKRL